MSITHKHRDNHGSICVWATRCVWASLYTFSLGNRASSTKKCCNTFLLLAFKTLGCLLSSQSCKANEHNNLKIVCQVSLCNLKLNISLCHFGQQKFYIQAWLFFWLGTTYLSIVLFCFFLKISFATIKAFWWNIMYISFWVVGENAFKDWNKDFIIETKGKWDIVWISRLVYWSKLIK